MVDCTVFDPMHCTIYWAFNSLRIIIPFLLGIWLGWFMKSKDANVVGGEE